MTNKYLYKYGRLNKHSEALFSGDEIYFASPSQLNDPFECRPYLTFEGTDEQYVDVYTTILSKDRPDLTTKEARTIALETLCAGSFKKREIWSVFRKKVIESLNKNIGLYCLTKKNNNILMFSHYGYDHKGYCLEFDASDTTPILSGALEVSYKEKYPHVYFFKTPNDEQRRLIFLTKFTDWGYEEEWRIIDHQTGPGLKRYPKELLKGIIFGMHMKDQDKKAIREWVKLRGTDVQFYEASRQEKEFSLAVDPV